MARIWLTGPTGLKKLTRCLLDAGSQSSFIHTSLVDQLQLPVLDQRDVIITPLQTARIWLTGPTGLKKLTRCLLDAGSQSSFIHTSLDQLQLPVLDQ